MIPPVIPAAPFRAARPSGMLRRVNPGPLAGGLVGRSRELARLGAWLDRARDGVGRLVLCVGEPGIGKTRLPQELADRARASGVVQPR